LKLRVIEHAVGNGKPVAGWRFGIGAVRPELGENAGVVAAAHDIRWIRLAGRGVDRVADTRIATVEEVVVLFVIIGIWQAGVAEAGR